MDHKHISDTWERADPYEQYMGRWSRLIAPAFLSWIGHTAGLRWLDVGCGTGAISAAIVDCCSPGLVTGVEPSFGFLKAAHRNLAGQVSLSQGTATAIPLAAASVDVVLSGLVLNFLTNPRAALFEMIRVTNRAGTIGAYVWDYARKMELLRLFWDTAMKLDPDVARMVEGFRFPLCNPDALRELFASVGLRGIEVTAIDTPAEFPNFDAYWQPFLGGQGPAPAYVMSLDADARARLRDRLREALPMQADGSILLVARAWAIRASTAG